MTRAPRVDPSGGWHHVSNRGARRYDTFIDDGDRLVFLQYVVEACRNNGVELVAYCLMGNHYHLVLHCPSARLSATVCQYAANYVRYFNRVHGFDGSLFKDRFHSKPIESDSALLQTIRYVHRNPLELGLRIDSYPWSSYLAYAGLAPRRQSLSSGLVLELAGGTKRFREFVETDQPSDKTSIGNGVSDFLRQPRVGPAVPRLDDVDAFVAESLDIDRCEVVRNTRGVPNTARMAAVLVAVDRGVDMNDVASHYRFTSTSSVRSAVSRARRRVETDPIFAQLFRDTIDAFASPGVASIAS